MECYKDLEDRKEKIRVFIRNNQSATYRDIKINLQTKVNKVFPGGMEEAYKFADIKPIRNIKHKNFQERKKILIDFIIKNPKAGGQVINKKTKINLFSVFNNTKEAFIAAGVNYPREEKFALLQRNNEEKKRQVIDILKDNPNISVQEIIKKSQANIYTLFKDIREVYKKAKIEYPGKGFKRKFKKRMQVISFLKKNPLATQREINSNCKTKIQVLYKKGIFDAYKEAGLVFPYERLKLHGSAIKQIRLNAMAFELRVAKILSRYGLVNRLVKTKRGIADIILERKENKVVVEIKNYKSHEISISQVKQLNRYLVDIGCELGFLICIKKPKKDTFLIGKNRIIVLELRELNKIPEYMDL